MLTSGVVLVGEWANQHGRVPGPSGDRVAKRSEFLLYLIDATNFWGDCTYRCQTPRISTHMWATGRMRHAQPWAAWRPSGVRAAVPTAYMDALADDGTDPSDRLVPLRRHYLS